MPRFVPRTILVAAALCWLAAGPGGVVVKAALACHHAVKVSQHGHMGHGPRVPGEGPCFCSQMIGAFDQAVSVAVASLSVPALHTASPIVTETQASLFPLPPSPVVTPETPPPIVA